MEGLSTRLFFVRMCQIGSNLPYIPSMHASIPFMHTAVGLMHSSCLDISFQYLLPIKARYSHIDRSLCFLSFTTAPLTEWGALINKAKESKEKFGEEISQRVQRRIYEYVKERYLRFSTLL